MSCGPAEALKGLADGIDVLDDKIDSLIEESPLGKLNELKGEAEAAVNGVMDAVNVMIPEIGLGVLDGLVPAGLQDDIKGIASFVLAGIASKDAFENQLNALKSKYANFDLGDFKDLDDRYMLYARLSKDKYYSNIERKRENAKNLALEYILSLIHI